MTARKPGSGANKPVAAIGLHYALDSEPGIRRQRAGKGFTYRSPRGTAIRAATTFARIRALAIPPAYRDVWICPDPLGHLQATGRDARGRKQYRYHPDWTRSRDTEKYARLQRFGKRLPALRRRLRVDLKQPGLAREKVLAVVVSLLMETRIRIGNPEYARQNHSYGLTTLRSRHVAFLRNGRALFHFRAKSGQVREVVLDDRRLAKLVRRCQHLPGQALFQYIDDEGQRHAVDSSEVNGYLRDAMGEAFSAKDFRTWTGTLTAIALLAKTALPKRKSERAFRAAEAAVIEEVAAELGNTTAVCRKAYICPGIFELWRAGKLQGLVPFEITSRPRQLEVRALRVLKLALGQSTCSINNRA